ncbi:hypothetical protein [Halomarina pelagica]|uniref:hypothetical protein n=1 Tax=Halomarina pelagica TaxID=2961599 RepID=UPI0020C3C09C|nr:hypothetical protein [Halomarina sp. BND7]
MSPASNLRRAITTPQLIFRYLNRQYYTLSSKTGLDRDRVDIFDEDWDNLVILDACRYDMFERQNELQGRLESRFSAGSSTFEFLQSNINGKSLLDTVYVTANPQFYHHRERISGQFHAVVNVWMDDGWDDACNTVLPETTTKYAKKATEQYPNKRLIIHYIQPHYPFLDESVDFDKQQLHEEGEKRAFWNEIFTGDLEVSREVVWDLYTQNLNRVLQSVAGLKDDLEGKTVITSDHGNMVGERSFPLPIREWGHPPGIHTTTLTKVPWLIINDGPRKEIISDRPSKERNPAANDDTVRGHLEDLGYL